MKQYQWTLASIIIACSIFPPQLFATTTSSNSSTVNQEAPKIILAYVNDQPIYKSQLKPQIQAELKKYQKLLPTKQIPEGIHAKIQNDILQQYINAELIHQASQKHTVKNIEKKVAQYIQTAKKNKQPIQSKVAIERQIRINEYLKAHDLISPQPTDEEVRAFYEKGKNKFVSTQDKIHVQHIFVEKANKENIHKAQELLLSGNSFEEVAKKYSDDENTKNKGGDLGFIPQGYMPKEFEEVALATPKNKLSSIIETGNGFHLLKVLGVRKAGAPIPYEKMKDFLARGLSAKTKEKRVTEHLTQLKNNATIKIFNTQN